MDTLNLKAHLLLDRISLERTKSMCDEKLENRVEELETRVRQLQDEIDSLWRDAGYDD